MSEKREPDRQANGLTGLVWYNIANIKIGLFLSNIIEASSHGLTEAKTLSLHLKAEGRQGNREGEG